MEIDEHVIGDEHGALGVELHRNEEMDENEAMELDDDDVGDEDGETLNEQRRDDINPFGFKLNKDSRKKLCRKSKCVHVFGPKDAYRCLERMFRVNGISVVHKLFGKRIFVTTTQQSNFFRIDSGRNVHIGISESKMEDEEEKQKVIFRMSAEIYFAIYNLPFDERFEKTLQHFICG